MAQKVHLQFLFSLDRSIFISILITHATISTVTEKNIWNGIFHAYQYLKYSSYFFFFFSVNLKDAKKLIQQRASISSIQENYRCHEGSRYIKQEKTCKASYKQKYGPDFSSCEGMWDGKKLNNSLRSGSF